MDANPQDVPRQEMIDSFDRLCLKILKEGYRVATKQPDGTVKIESIDPPGKVLDVIRGRIKDFGASTPEPGTPTERLQAEARRRAALVRPEGPAGFDSDDD